MFERAMLRTWVLLALGGAGAAQAQNYDFDFSYTSNGVGVTGTFVTVKNSDNTSYTIQNIINGMRGGNSITLLAPLSVSSAFNGRNDNGFRFPANPGYFDTNGVGYTSGGVNYDIFYYDSYREQANGRYTTISSVTVTPVPAPLPGGGLLSFLALGLAGLIHRRRTVLARGREALARFRLWPAAGLA